MKKVFISQPMRGKTKEQILQEREVALGRVKELLGTDVVLIDSYIQGVPATADKALWCLGRSLQMMAESDFVYFANGWRKARGCRLEQFCTKEYGKDFAAEDLDYIRIHMKKAEELFEVNNDKNIH